MASRSSGKKRKKKPDLPEKIGKYVVTRLVGEGGMGRVFRGVDPDTKGVVALKTILEERLTSPAALPRFLREMQILAALDHPNIVHILDRGIFQGGHYLVMDYVDGKPLDEVIRDNDNDVRERVLNWCYQIADALGYLHRNGVMHRDLKPGNIILRPDDTVTLIDFGLSRFLEPGGTVTGVGRVIGSPHYLPPEQWRGERPDARADVYQFGILALELLTGKVPFSGTDLRAIMDSCLNYGVTEKLLATMGVEGTLAEFLVRCCARAKQERYQDMETLLEDMDNVRQGRPLSPMADPPTLIESASIELEPDTDEVDLDAPTAEERPARDPRLAASFYRPPEAVRGMRGGGTPRPAREPSRDAAGRPRLRVPAAVEARGFPRPVVPPGAWAALAVVVVLSAGLVWVTSRPPPPEPVPEIVSGPRVVDGVAAARVEWETDRPSLGRVELKGPEGLRVVHDDDGVRRDHAVTLSDLRPGTAYELQVRGPKGPLGDPVTFTARGVSIAFDPLFTPRGLELHWTSEDPLVLKGDDGATQKRPGDYPRKQGSLFLPGVRPGEGRVTVLAYAPLGSVMPVVWTVPEVSSIAGPVSRLLLGLTTGTTRKDVEEFMAGGQAYDAARLLEKKAGEVSQPFRPAQLLSQASLVIQDPALPRARRVEMIDAIQELRLLERRLQLRSTELRLPVHLVAGERFAWGAQPGIRPRGRILAGRTSRPAPLTASSRDPIDEPAFVWTPDLTSASQTGTLTLLVHCTRLSPALYLRVKVAGGPRLVLMSDQDTYQAETIDRGEGWTMVHHRFDAGMLPLRGGRFEVSLHSLVPAFAGRAVLVSKLELVDGVYGPEG